MSKIDFNALRDRAYKCACEHGFHNTELINEHFLCLVISELMEAVEEKALVKTKDGAREENLYCVMLHYPNGKMYFEEFFESELELVQH